MPSRPGGSWIAYGGPVGPAQAAEDVAFDFVEEARRAGTRPVFYEVGAEDVPVMLDLKESAQLGMGPHGICIGATGSGKSELLRTLVLGLALSHSPDDLSMILVDYKGGAAFAPFARLPVSDLSRRRCRH